MIGKSPFVPAFQQPYQSSFSKKVKEETKKFSDRENRYVNFNASSSDGCMMYRRGFLSNHIMMTNGGDVTNLTKMVTDERFYADVKTITLQRQASTDQKAFFSFLKSIQPKFGFKIIYEVDDVVFREDIPDYNSSKHAFDTDEIRQNCIDMINMADEVTVTCKFMRDLFIERTGKKEITAIPNFMPYWWSGHQYDYNRIVSSYEKNKKKPRIVYAGSGAHFDLKNQAGQKDDFEHVNQFIIDNRHKYQFIFIGACPNALVKYVTSREIEFHPWVSLLEYPNFLSSLNAQLFLAPLQDNNFNKSKSDIKFIEAAQLGIPCLCQDLVTYSTAPEFLRFKTVEELQEKVEKLLNWKNRSAYFKLVPELRKVGASRFLELPDNYGAFMESLDTHYGDPSRRILPRLNA